MATVRAGARLSLGHMLSGSSGHPKAEHLYLYRKGRQGGRGLASCSAPFLPVTPSLSPHASFAQASDRPGGQPVCWGSSSPPVVRNVFGFSRLENATGFGSTSDRFCNSPAIILRHHFWKIPSPWPFLALGRQCVYETPGLCSHLSLCSSARLRSGSLTFKPWLPWWLSSTFRKYPSCFVCLFSLFSVGEWPSIGQSESRKQKF